MRGRIERGLNAIWYEGRPGAVLLAPLALAFGLVSALRRSAYRRGVLPVHRPGVPVVVVGNLSVGGTGKTPLTAWLVEGLARQGIAAGVLLRGYGAAPGEARRVTPGADPARFGDEAVMLAATTGAPVVVAADRAAGARLLEEVGVRLIVCDDGLQHYALARDLEIAVVDAARGLGNGRLLPAGPLREPPGRLAEVDFVVSNGVGAAADASALQMRLVAGEARSLVEPGARRPLSAFTGGPVHAVAAIGNPARFFATLREAGLQPVEHAFPDHHPFISGDLAFGDGRPVLMTAKDAVKCRAFADARMWEVPVSAALSPDGGRALLARVAALVPGTAE